MQLAAIEIEGFKSIEKMRLDLCPLNVLIGANGAGKSNFIAAFGLLNRIVESRLQWAVGKKGGAGTFLHHGPKRTQSIRFQLEFPPNGYEAVLGAAENDSLFFERETCWYQGAQFAKPFDVRLGSGHRETALPEEAKRQPGKVASHVLEALRSWRVHHFHDTSDTAAVKQKQKVDDNAALRADAANLAPFLSRLRATDAGSYRRIVAAIRQVAPFFDDFQLRPDPVRPDTIQLEWSEQGSDAYLNAHALSDGTLRFICLATLLLQPTDTLPSLILIDEPELGLHPYAISQLADMLSSAAQRTQVLVATQSVTLMNQFDPQHVVVVDREGSASRFRRVTEAEVARWTDEYALGDLWEKNVIGGRPQRS
jgi:predicted ATPase